MLVTVFLYEDIEELNNKKEELTNLEELVGGFAQYNKTICNIHVIEGKKQFEIWGHELAHCLYGKWHK